MALRPKVVQVGLDVVGLVAALLDQADGETQEGREVGRLFRKLAHASQEAVRRHGARERVAHDGELVVGVPGGAAAVLAQHALNVARQQVLVRRAVAALSLTRLDAGVEQRPARVVGKVGVAHVEHVLDRRAGRLGDVEEDDAVAVADRHNNQYRASQSSRRVTFLAYKDMTYLSFLRVRQETENRFRAVQYTVVRVGLRKPTREPNDGFAIDL